MSDPFMGEIRPFAFSWAPRGWAFCDGSYIDIQENPALFSILTTTFGGDGRSTFALPNLSGRTPMGTGAAPGLTPSRLGQWEGYAGISLHEGHLPEHNHTVYAYKKSGTSDQPSNVNYLTMDPRAKVFKSDPTDDLNPMAQESLAESGQSQPHLNLQPYLVVNYCINMDGQYPSRN